MLPPRHDHLAAMRAPREPTPGTATDPNVPQVTSDVLAHLEGMFGPEAQIRYVHEKAKDDPVQAVYVTQGWAEVLHYIRQVNEAQAHVRSQG